MKALFFLRHYNDIDHITPVISKWIESAHHCDIILIGKPKFRYDYRIEFLRQVYGVRIAHIRDLLMPFEFLRWQLQTLLLVNSVRRLFGIGRLFDLISGIYGAKQRKRTWDSVNDCLLERSFKGIQDGVVVFDWITKDSPVSIEWVETLISAARDMGYGAVSLPHGDSPHATQLIRHHEWSLEAGHVIFRCSNI